MAEAMGEGWHLTIQISPVRGGTLAVPPLTGLCVWMGLGIHSFRCGLAWNYFPCPTPTVTPFDASALPVPRP